MADRSPTLPAPPDANWRKAERRRLVAARLALSDGARVAASAAIETALAARVPPGAYPVLAGYWPIQGEWDPLPYLTRTLAAGGAVALPVARRPAAPLEFRLWTADAPMTAGLWGLPHPADGAVVTPSALLIPLVGFDGRGHRLGNGGGYYDRTLAALSPRPLAIGVGFELGRLGSIAPEAHDQPMDLIVTEAGVQSIN